MRKQHADPTADAAIGAANKEWFQMVELALRMKRYPQCAKDAKLVRRFTGIYRRLLDELPEELDLILQKKKQ